ncbi:MAG: DsrE family protein [Proteobacteria bacterium]|nr:DsrE family protein [Pseudomonadota bacterium]
MKSACKNTILALALSLSAMPAMAGDVPAITVDKNSKDGRYMFNVTLHSEKEIEGLLARAKQLKKTMRKGDEKTGIALVLHGPEIKFFSKKNYKRYKKIVDDAALLDADQVIDIKICKTQMGIMDIKEEELPAFIDIVPYGPAEEERLKKKGYVYL